MERGTVDDAQRLLEEMSARPRPPGRDCWIFIDLAEALITINADLRARLERAEADLRAKEKQEYRVFQELKYLSDVAERLPVLLRTAEAERDAALAELEQIKKETTPNG